MVVVKNVNGTDRFNAPPGYLSWLDYWQKQTGCTAYICGNTLCNRRDLVGAHVQKANSTDKSYYITPLCRACNNRTDHFKVDTVLVPVPSNL